MSDVCPKGHFSTDAAYCSECGMRMEDAIAAVATQRCPDCGTPRFAAARFCEVCRFDFQAQLSFSGLVQAPAPVHSAPPLPSGGASSTLDQAPVARASAQRLLLRVVVDPSLCEEPDPDTPCPQDAPQKIFHLDLEENTLGRQYEGKGVHPEIVIEDPGISRRHLKFIRDDRGGFSVLELGSANGTGFNGNELEAGVMTPVKPGDQLTLGMWTRLHVEER